MNEWISSNIEYIALGVIVVLFVAFILSYVHMLAEVLGSREVIRKLRLKVQEGWWSREIYDTGFDRVGEVEQEAVINQVINHEDLNLVEIIKNQTIKTVYSPICGEGKPSVNDKGEIITLNGWGFRKNGTVVGSNQKSISLLFPSVDMYAKYPQDAELAWTKWLKRDSFKLWRAEVGGEYWHISLHDIVPGRWRDNGRMVDDRMYSCGNYFRTEEDAMKAGELVKAVIMKFHQRNERQD